jgi:hypothetical protein
MAEFVGRAILPAADFESAFLVSSKKPAGKQAAG